MKTLIITTPNNPGYSGETFGVKFELGEAMVSELSRPNKYQHDMDFSTTPPTRNLDILAQKFRALLDGYVVRVHDDTPQQVTVVSVGDDPVPTPTLADLKKAGAK